jgi:hypothetical protein
MIKYLSTLLFILLVGCAAKRISTNENEKFVEYVNDNKTTMRLDAEVVKDKDFKLQIPFGLQKSQVKVSNCFLHILNFNNDEKIVLLYMPDRKNTADNQSFSLSYADFKSLCIKENILENIESISMLENRRFGINRLNNVGFYAIYLNIKRNEVSAFNYSINSISL